MSYIDGFVAAIPTANKMAYLEHVKQCHAVFKEYGLVRMVECWGDDVPDGKVTSFPMAVQCQDDETVVFGWLEWPSREVRDAGMAKAMKDPRLQPEQNPMPFDGMRLIYGGFSILFDSENTAR